MSVSRRKWVLAKILKASGALVVTAFPPLVAAEGGDDFSNNLFSDMAPILALFGEQVAKQFMSQSMGWADNILFAMAPLGVITAIVGAIRVAGPPILKVIVGRARENRAAAEVDLMSSTSDDVCELWNGQMIVRMMGSPPVLELVFLPSRKDEPDCGLLTLGEPTKCLVPHHPRDKPTVKRAIIRGEPGTETANPQSEPGVETATPQGEPDVETAEENEPIGDTPKSAPNIFLNLYPPESRTILRLSAGFAIVLQLGVLLYSGFVSYWLKRGKEGWVVPYGYPLTATGTVLLVIGMLICSHVVEQSTVERTWDIKPEPENQEAAPEPQARILWLQRGGYINDQSFSSFCIFGHDTRGSILTSRRREAFRKDSTILIWLYSRLRGPTNRNEERSDTSASPEKYLEFLVIAGTLTSVFGFIIQFIGLRSMHWSASIAQLGATVIMIFIRALVRLRLADPPPAQRIPDGYELDWLATRIGDDPEPLWSSLGKPESGDYPSDSPDGILDEKCWNWSVVAGVGRDKFDSLDESEFDSGPNDVARIRMRLGELSNWTGPVSKFAISVARSVEAVMNTIFTLKEYPKLETFAWSVFGHRGGSKPGKINLNVSRGEDKQWVACAPEVEAVLSLWLYSMRENNRNTIPNPMLSSGGTRVDWLRHGQAAVQQRTIRLLGGNEEYYCRDLHWYLGEGVNIISQVQVEESPVSETKDPASPTTCTSNIAKIETRNIVGFTKDGSVMAPNHQRFTRFRTQGIQLYSGGRETTPNLPNSSGQTERYDHLAVVSDSQIELLLAQDLFSSFMWGAADKMHTLSVESTLHQTDQIQPTDSAWFDSLRLENTALSNMAREIERAGLGRPEDAFASIIPPLSIKRKLPIPRCLVTQARERAQNHFAHENWEAATDVYSKLFGICIAFGQTSPLAAEATAAVYEALRTARAARCLWERWRPCLTEVVALQKQELDLQQLLGAADAQAVLNIRTMYEAQRRRADSDEDTSNNNGHQMITDSESGNPPGDSITDFSQRDKDFLHLTLLHCYVIEDEAYAVDRCLRAGANVDVQDVLGWTPLHYAATNGSLRITRRLLSTTGSAGANPDIKDFAGRTALHQAGDNGHEEVVKLLLGNGAHIGEDNHGSTPLHLAAQNGHAGTAQVLLASGADKEPRDKFGSRPLHCAANNGHLEVVRLLLEKSVDKEPEDRYRQRPLHHAAYNGHLEVVRLLLLEEGANKEAESHSGQRPLHHAARNGHLEVVQLLLESGTDKEAKDNEGGRPLHLAADCECLKRAQLLHEKGAGKEPGRFDGSRYLHDAADSRRLEIVRLLLEEGADKEAEDKNWDRPLHRAAYSGQLDVVRLLLERGADKEAEAGLGHRPLHDAARNGQLEVVQLLLENGADMEAKNRQVRRPLHQAAYNGHLEVVRLLLEKDADMEAEDEYGDRPLHDAADKGQLEVVRLLLENGADKEAKNKEGQKPKIDITAPDT